MATTSINTRDYDTQRTDTGIEDQNTGSVLNKLAAAGSAMVRHLNLMYDIYGERRQMQNLSDETLRDLGITRAQLNEECSRSLTDVAANRSRY